MEIKGKTILVTGGARGIGYAIAEYFLKSGANIIISDILESELATAVLQLKKVTQATVLGFVSNVADEASVLKLYEDIEKTGGGLDVAVLNAGILRDGLLLKVDKSTGTVIGGMSLEQWKAVIDVNLTGVFLTGREAAKLLIKQKRGGVIVTISSLARHGNFGQSNYSAAKAGVAALTVVWSKELAKYGIRVDCVAPGFIETPMVLKDMKPEALEVWKKQIPIGRLGKPEEIAHTIKYIVENDLLTGSVIEVNGGSRL